MAIDAKSPDTLNVNVARVRAEHEKHVEALTAHEGADVLLTQIVANPGQFTLRQGSAPDGAEEEEGWLRVN